jgi:hypothetical protein
MKCKLLLLVISSFMLVSLFAQTKNTSHASQTWLAYFNQTRLNNKWGLWGDFQLRTREEVVSDL